MATETKTVEKKSRAEAKLLQAQQAAKAVEKKGRNKDQNYDYVLAADVIEAAQAALHGAGLVGVMSFTEAEERPVQSKGGTHGVYCLLRAELKIFDPETANLAASSTGFGAGIDYPGDKAVYKAMTGATKYAYAAALGIPFGDDPEDTTTAAPEAREGAEERKGFASDKQRDYLRSLLDKADAPDSAGIEAYLEANFSGGRTGGISKAIDKLKDNPATAVAELDSLAQEWHLQQESDVPKDEADLPDPDQREAEDAKQETLT
jgi:hypothetical protein